MTNDKSQFVIVPEKEHDTEAQELIAAFEDALSQNLPAARSSSKRALERPRANEEDKLAPGLMELALALVTSGTLTQGLSILSTALNIIASVLKKRRSAAQHFVLELRPNGKDAPVATLTGEVTDEASIECVIKAVSDNLRSTASTSLRATVKRLPSREVGS